MTPLSTSEGHILHGDHISVVFGQFAYFNHRISSLVSLHPRAKKVNEGFDIRARQINRDFVHARLVQ